MTTQERHDYAQEMFDKHPELFPEERRAAILAGIVTLGMAPFEAKLAGGAFSYKVTADATVWPPHSDPLKVMWAQSQKADASEIWMSFRNLTQFQDGQEHAFRVHFAAGRAVSIDPLDD
ncbi:MAG: hypothetical protein RI907_1868 [Pseudomonadota bacterium]|jgi:hypothetical protein